MIHKAFVVLIAAYVVGAAAHAIGAMNWLMPKDGDGASLLRNTFTGFVGAYCGFLLATHQRKREQDAEKEQRRLRLLERLESVFQDNRGILLRMQQELTSGIYDAPSFLCDVGSLAGLSVMRSELLPLSSLRSLIDHAEYEMNHINRRVDLMLDRFPFSPLADTMVRFSEARASKVISDLTADPATAPYAERLRNVAFVAAEFDQICSHKAAVLKLIYGTVRIVQGIEAELMKELGRVAVAQNTAAS